jgi:putative DNA primase/helicase
LDLDGDSASVWFRARGAEPDNAGWRTTRAEDRQKAHYRLPDELLHALVQARGEAGLSGKITLTTKEAPPGGKAEQIELFIASGQCVIAGQPSEGPPYKNHGSPQSVTEPDEAMAAALIELVKAAPKPEPRSGGEHTPGESWQSGPDSPCPVCGRNSTGGCTIWVSDEENTRLGVNCLHGGKFQPPKEIDMPGFVGKRALEKGDVVPGADGGQWVYCRQGQNPAVGVFSTFLQDRPREQASPCPTTSELEGGHFKILGWADGQREEICYRASRTKQIAFFKCKARTELLRLAPLEHWIEVYGREPEEQNRPRQATPDWDAALSDVIGAADRCGVFDRGSLRGHGVWLDQGRAVWHLGDRLEVDGQMSEIDGIEGANHYERLYALGVDPGVVSLQNNEGEAVLSVIRQMGWASPLDALHLAGWLVLANVGGALPKRPGLQLTSSSGSGKSDCVTEVILPLLAGVALYSSTSSEAGVRQSLKASSTPAVIDESEQENPKKREAQLRLVRLSYDGVTQLMGTPSGEARNFAMRSSICLVGINATIPNVADRNRIVVISRQQIQQEQWESLARRRDELITRGTGERLIRRTVSNLHTLLANVETFGRVVARRYGGRFGDTYGALLAGAHHLTSLEVVDEAQAQRWMQAQRWELSDEALVGSAAKDEASQCLEHLLKHELPFNEAKAPDWGSLADSHGMVSVREMVDYLAAYRGDHARGCGEDFSKSAERILGRNGLKVDLERGLLVHTGERGKLRDIYASTRWANGAFKDRLLDLPGAVRVPSAVRIKALGGPVKCIALPLKLITD